jgi:hypothetical protein
MHSRNSLVPSLTFPLWWCLYHYLLRQIDLLLWNLFRDTVLIQTSGMFTIKLIPIVRNSLNIDTPKILCARFNDPCQLWRTVGRHIHAVVVHCNYFQSFCCTFQFTNTTFSWHLFSPKKYERGNPRCTVWCVSHPLPQQLFGKREIINVPRHGISYGKS